jgi:hypothetical protein
MSLSGAAAAIGWAMLVAAAIPILYVLLAYAALRLALELFPPIDSRHDTDLLTEFAAADVRSVTRRAG